MKRLFVGLVLVAVALSVNAGVAQSASAIKHVHSNAPVCPPGEKAVPQVINGKLVWTCVPD
jgi:hypothetical protein